MDQVFGFVGWTFLPSLVTSILQSTYYKLTVPVGRVPPQPGTPLYAKHHRRIRVFVLTLYLIYTLLQSLYDIKLQGDFFTLLSVNPITPDREIRSHFRRLAAKIHPDKLRNHASSNIPPTSNPGTPEDTFFVVVKRAQDVLLNPPLRYAYTRFGPSITRIQPPSEAHQPTIQNYVLAGLRYSILPSYCTQIATLVVTNYFFLPKWGSYWRYLVLCSIVVAEFYFLTHSDSELSFTTSPPSSTTSSSFSSSSPSSSGSSLSTCRNFIFSTIATVYTTLQRRTKLKHILPPHLLPYQLLTILHKLSVSLNIFISQLAPPQQQQQSQSASMSQHKYEGADGNSATVSIVSRINQNLAHLHQIAKRTDEESTSLLSLQMTPYKGNRDLVLTLREGMSEGMVNSAIRQHPEVKAAIESVITQREKPARSHGTQDMDQKLE